MGRYLRCLCPHVSADFSTPKLSSPARREAPREGDSGVQHRSVFDNWIPFPRFAALRSPGMTIILLRGYRFPEISSEPALVVEILDAEGHADLHAGIDLALLDVADVGHEAAAVGE